MHNEAKWQQFQRTIICGYRKIDEQKCQSTQKDRKRNVGLGNVIKERKMYDSRTLISKELEQYQEIIPGA